MGSSGKKPSAPFTGVEVLLGVTGGIAAYKAADLTSRLVQRGAGVTVVLTEAARHFIGATTFEALTGRAVHGDHFQPREHFQGEHIGLARRADVFVVAPASADYIAKVANGLADDLLSTLALSATCPMIMAPAMNADMWAKPAVQRNIAQIRADGWQVIDPGEGWLSCGQIGPGRMAEPDDIVASLESSIVSESG